MTLRNLEAFVSRLQYGRRRLEAVRWLYWFCESHPNFGLGKLVRDNWGEPVAGISMEGTTWWSRADTPFAMPRPRPAA